MLFVVLFRYGCFNPYWVFKLAATVGDLTKAGVSKGFNPYWVFKLAATLASWDPGKILLLCFNPYWVFKLAATNLEPFAPLFTPGFNPYWVFKLAATGASAHTLLSQTPCFNPYWVFKLAATDLHVCQGLINIKFQSLLGFQARCNSQTAEGGGWCIICFNPYWVFKLAATCVLGAGAKISISFNPYWVFKLAATYVSVTPSEADEEFQSLLGFQARCNVKGREAKERARSVSIPIGFSSSLQPQARQRELAIRLCFNPYWVFKLAATSAVNFKRSLPLSFQSLLGFQARCNCTAYPQRK